MRIFYAQRIRCANKKSLGQILSENPECDGVDSAASYSALGGLDLAAEPQGFVEITLGRGFSFEMELTQA